MDSGDVERFEVNSWSGWSLIRSGSAGGECFDALSWTPTERGARAVVADAAVGPHHDRDVSRSALEGVVDGLGASVTLPGGFATVASKFCDPELRPRQANPLTCAASVEVDVVTGEVVAMVAGDCEVWVRLADRWVSLFPADMLVPEARALWETLREVEGSWPAQLEVLDSPLCWVRPPVGLTVPLRVPSMSIVGVEAVVVASDGAKLSWRSLKDLGGHLEDLLAGEHGDVAVWVLTAPDVAPILPPR